MAGIRLRRRIALGKSGDGRLQPQITGPAAAAQAQHFAVPGVRQSVDDADVRILHRRDNARDFAIGRRFFGGVRRDFLGRRDRRMRERGRGHLRAGIRPGLGEGR